MSKVYFITHPEVDIDPATPVPQWQLSERGRDRMRTMLKQPWLPTLTRLYASREQKAIDGAMILSDHLNIDYHTIAELGENDRSSTGYMPANEFESVADEFFAHPEKSILGWETAKDAQKRIVNAVQIILNATSATDTIGIVSHGAVGTLLMCKLQGLRISREYDQPGYGGGNYFTFERGSERVLHGWQPIDDVLID